jgi:hypothetical protein
MSDARQASKTITMPSAPEESVPEPVTQRKRVASRFLLPFSLLFYVVCRLSFYVAAGSWPLMLALGHAIEELPTDLSLAPLLKSTVRDTTAERFVACTRAPTIPSPAARQSKSHADPYAR